MILDIAGGHIPSSIYHLHLLPFGMFLYEYEFKFVTLLSYAISIFNLLYNQHGILYMSQIKYNVWLNTGSNIVKSNTIIHL